MVMKATTFKVWLRHFFKQLEGDVVALSSTKNCKTLPNGTDFHWFIQAFHHEIHKLNDRIMNFKFLFKRKKLHRDIWRIKKNNKKRETWCF
jgi:hypothetical protein